MLSVLMMGAGLVWGVAAADVAAIPAAEFAKYHREMTGRDPAPGMVEFAVDPKISKSGNDAYRIVSTATGVKITGSNGRSLQYGVYDLLARRGGCRWFWDGDVVPKRATLDLSGLDIAEESRFEYRGLRYFAHRGLTRFQAEHWGFEDWKREIDWMLKNRLNFFMPRIGMDDTWQKAYPDIVKYPDPNAPADDNLTGYNNRVSAWGLRYRGELRKRFTEYAFARGLMVPTDFGTMTHWYSRTPVEFLKTMKPPFLPNSNGQYGERTGLVWDIFQGDWLNHYWHLTQTFIDAGYGTPDLLHTIGLGERMCYRDRAKNLQMKKDVLDLLTKKALSAYPNSKILLAGWDFYSTWRADEVRALLPQLDPNKVLILDYEADALARSGSAEPSPARDFTQWGFVGKFPYTFGIFLTLEQGIDVRANYDVIRNRQKIIENDPFCKGYILWPESSHTDIVLLDYFTRNAWQPQDLDVPTLLTRFCADRYGARADEFRPLWEKVLPASQLRGWDGTYCRLFTKSAGFTAGGWDKPANAGRLAQWESKAALASGIFPVLANMKWEGEFVRRDTIDLARTALDRIITQRGYSFSRDLYLWRAGKRTGADLAARADNIAALAEAMADVLALHTDYSLWESYLRLDAVEKVKSKNFTKVLFDNASCSYCRSQQYEFARHWYLPRANAFAAQVSAAVKANDRSDKVLAFPDGERARRALMELPLESLKPTLPRTEETFQRTMRKIADLLAQKPGA